MTCPAADKGISIGVREGCALQRLADQTVMGAHARRANIAAIVILIDLDTGHTALAASILEPATVARVLADEAAGIRQSAS